MAARYVGKSTCDRCGFWFYNDELTTSQRGLKLCHECYDQNEDEDLNDTNRNA